MSTSAFAAFKNAQKGGNLAKLREKIESEQKGRRQRDERWWVPTVDKSGNGYAVIRFLPEPKGEASPYVKVYDHGFKENGKWYIDKCATTLGGACPVCEHNGTLWNSEIDENIKIARSRGRRESYHANIIVISDSAAPENEGKVFLFRFGKKIFKKIMNKINPEFADEEPMNPFNFWEGANFKLKIKNEDGYRNYDSSDFAAPSMLFDGDDELIEKLWSQQHSLEALLDPSLYPEYEDALRKFNSVVRKGTSRDEDGDIPFGNESQKTNSSRATKREDPPWNDKEDFEPPKKKKVEVEEDDDDMDMYKKLLEG